MKTSFLKGRFQRGGVAASCRALACLLWVLLPVVVACGAARETQAMGELSPAPASGGGRVCGSQSDEDGDGEADCSDPDCLGSTPDPTRPTSFADTISWLYAPASEACAPLQQSVTPGALQSGLVSVVRGRVSDTEGSPLAGAEISVVGAPQFGRTRSRADGYFDIAVNGGTKVTLQITGDGYIPVHRQAGVLPNAFSWVEPALLTPRSAVASRVELGAASQLLRAEVTEDGAGRRQPTIIFPANTQAMAQGADGGMLPLDSATVRVTEFTVGDRGGAGMPADLPSSSAYTYAIELSVDEAEEMGASGVVFDQSLPIYLENFLDFPAGTAVPVGFYDRERAEWQAQRDGLVIAVLGIDEGVAAIDADGDGVADPRSALNALAISDDELRRLAEQYEPGQSLWRVPVQHFSLFDFNWPFGFPDDVAAPELGELPLASTDGSGCATGSIIRVDNQTLGESVGVAGTGYGLFYQSDRASGGQPRRIDLEVAGSSLPASLKRIDATLSIAGARHEQQIAAAPAARFRHDWDGKNAYGRPLQGAQRYDLRVAYVYDGVYTTTGRSEGNTAARSFAQPGSVRLSGDRARQEVSTERVLTGTLGGWDARANGLGGFTLDVHHAYDKTGILYYGDGRQRSAETLPPIPQLILPDSDELAPREPRASADGTLFFASGDIVYRFAGGEVIAFAGGGTSSADGIAATDAALDSLRDIQFGPDGSVYFWSDGRLRRVGTDGLITTLLGGGDDILLDDGDLATEVDVIEPAGLAISGDGVVYFAESALSEIFRLTAQGRLELVSGGNGAVVDGTAALAFDAGTPNRIAFAPDGSLYITEYNKRISRIAIDGIGRFVTAPYANPIAPETTGDGGLAELAHVSDADDITFDRSGTVYFVEDNGLRVIDTSGFIDTLVEESGDFSVLTGITMSPDGNLYVAASGGIYKVAPALPGSALGDSIIPAEDGSEVYRFDATGRHLATFDGLMGVELRRFEYDAEGRLLSVIEEGLRTTRIERDGSGTPTAIVSPYGVRTTLAVDPDGYLQSVTDAAGQSVQFEYGSGGLLTAMVDERGGRHEYTYDESGKLLTDRDPSGEEQTLSGSADGTRVSVTRTTPLGLVTRHERAETRAGFEQTVTTAGGSTTHSLRAGDGTFTLTRPDGTVARATFAADPRFGAVAPISAETRVTLPSGLESVVTQTRTAELANASDPLSLIRLGIETSANGRTSTSEYDAATRTLVQRSPEGRESTTVLDASGRVVQTSVPGLLPTGYEYDADGRLVTVTSGDRRVRYQHTAEGWVGSATDALGQTTSYAFDAVGRISSQTYADGAVAAFAYDAASQLTSLTPPGQAPHGFAYDLLGLVSQYDPPALPSGATPTTYGYDADQRLTELVLPGRDPLRFAYDAAGHLVRIDHDGGATTLSYDAAERLVEATSAGGVVLTYAYDGALPAGTTYGGPVSGSIVPSYDQDFFVTALAVNGTSVDYDYDDDGLLTAAGELLLTHDPTNGLLTATDLLDTVSAHTYTPQGELDTLTLTADGAPLYAADHDYDALGRVSAVSETIAGTSVRTEYAYDSVGQLTQVTTDGTLSASYAYDDDGNRQSASTAATLLGASYDAQERLLSSGDNAYAYTPDGALESRSNANGTTRFAYDSAGSLTSVTLPDGSAITYLSDAGGRRVQRSVDGAVTHAWLYQNDLSPIAELDPTGAIVSRFVYASRANVPDLLLRGGATYRILTDLRGSVRLVVDAANGTVAQRIDYGPFGEVLADSSPGFQPFGFAGGLYDPATGLVRSGARDYDPEVGRWTSKDPIGFGGGQANLYAYVGNDPVNFVDPSGTIGFLAPIAIRAGAGAAADGLLDFTLQMAANGGRVGCVDWGQVASSAVEGAVLGAIWPGAGGSRLAARTAGKTVLGRYPAYVNKAAELNARRFNVPIEVWERMAPAERWAANRKFLDRMIARGDDVILASPVKAAEPGTYFARELEYLRSKGFTLSSNGTRMLPPKP